MAAERTRAAILDAAERLLAAAHSLDDVTVRRIAEEAAVNPAAIGYHFGSREKLVLAVTHRIYDRLNTERLTLLQAAIDRGAPGPAAIDEVLAALVGPSIRWSRDPSSGYGVFVHFDTITQRARDPAPRRAMAERVEHLEAFIPVLARAAPWFDLAEIGWRIHCALGVRHYSARSTERARILTGGVLDVDDTEEVVRWTVEVIAAMFAAPARSRPGRTRPATRPTGFRGSHT